MTTGEREINSEEAAVVRRIFESYAAGLAQADRKDPEQRRRARSAGITLEFQYDPWKPETRHRDAE
jgi:hypothetical protein